MLSKIRGCFGNMLQRLSSPIPQACQRPEIAAAARLWRDRLARARIGSRLDASLEPTVSAPLSTSELDAFEKSLALQFARAHVYVPHHPLFSSEGSEVCIYVIDAVGESGISTKFQYWGFFSRIRILPQEVSYEEPPYGSRKWTVFWRA